MKIVLRWRPLALWSIALFGFALRLYGLNWDQGNSFHPDERQILFHVTVLSWPTSFAQFLDPVNSPLNPHFFAYGSFPLYLLASLGNLLSHFWPSITSFTNLTLVGRVLSALFDSGTILLTGLLALRLVKDATPGRTQAWNVALLAAALVAFTPFELQLSHFYAVDTMLLFFVTLTLLACVALVDTDKPLRWAVLAGIAYGLAVGTKFSAAPLGVPLLVAALMRWYRCDLFSALASLLGALFVTGITFLIVEPYALLDTKNVLEQIAEQGNLARGTLDLPYVRQFAGTIPFVYEAQNMIVWGLGLMLGIAACVGLLWLLWRVWKRDAGLWMVVLSWVLIYGAINCSFYAKFMRYMLPIYPFFTLMAAALLVMLSHYDWQKLRIGNIKVLVPVLRYGAIVVVLAGTIFQGLALLNVYSTPNTRILASRWIYAHIPPGSVLTYEQWDDPLPVSVDGHDPSIYTQATYQDASGQPATGLDLYGDDTVEKAQLLARLLPTVNAITMPTNRLDKSIPRLPFRYPLTIHYYQLLYSGQLGFHLAALFDNHPHLLGITLDDSSADESYSVFDHPTAHIFVRDTPYPYTQEQLLQKLLDGIQLPPAAAQLSGAQRSLMLSPLQIADDQQAPPFGVQFPADSIANAAPIFFWWLVLTLLSLLTCPLLFLAFRVLCDRGYLFSKTLGLLLLAYVAWMLAVVHVVPFSHTSGLIALSILALTGGLVFFVQRHAMITFVRQHWRLLLIEEALFSVVYLLFVVIRSFNPDLWHIYLGGEKPMELAFLNAVLRSSYMPPLDPWFAGGYINYYYYGYVIFGVFIKLTGILPTTAFNLAIPTLFALTFSGVVVILYSLTRRFSIALLGGYFAAGIGNLNGLIQLKGQVLALSAQLPVPTFDYWQSSRIIPFTINEFPFWSFLFADLHPHVIDMPITVCMLGIVATFLLSSKDKSSTSQLWCWEQVLLYGFAAFIFGTIACVNPWDMPLYAILFALALLVQSLYMRREQETPLELLISLAFQCVAIAALYALGYLFYLPFYANYQQLYVNGLGLVKLGTTTTDFLTVFGLWIFLAASFIVSELYRRWPLWREKRAVRQSGTRGSFFDALHGTVFAVICAIVLLAGIVLGPKVLLFVLLVPAVWLFVTNIWQGLSRGNAMRIRRGGGGWGVGGGPLGRPSFPLVQNLAVENAFPVEEDEQLMTGWATQGSPPLHSATPAPTGTGDYLKPITSYTYLLIILGLCICLGIELVYVRDFLDGEDYERMNTVFKFSIQAWLCLAIGGALVVQRLWLQYPKADRRDRENFIQPFTPFDVDNSTRMMPNVSSGFALRGVLRHTWSVMLVVLILACSVFLTEGIAARVHDHQGWIDAVKPAYSADYTPSIDGFAFVRAWYPGDAQAITWLNEHVAGAPVILEAAAPVSYQWFNRVSVFTGLPDVLGWPDHVGEQRYDYQSANRVTDIGLIYTTTDTVQTLELLHFYHVRYVYVGPLEQQLYAQQTSAGLDKFAHMQDVLHVVYNAVGVTIYEIIS